MTIFRIPKWPVLFEWRKAMIVVVNIHIFKSSATLFCKPSFFFSWSQLVNIEPGSVKYNHDRALNRRRQEVMFHCFNDQN